MNSEIPLLHTIILAAAGMIGAAAIIPYTAGLRSGTRLTGKIIVLSLIQSAIFMSAASLIGRGAASGIGLELMSTPAAAGKALLLGLLAGVIILILEITVFLPRLPGNLTREGRKALPVWKRFSACLYGGISEEILTRWFLMTLLIWLTGKLVQFDGNTIPQSIFWTANIIAAGLFALGHLPATKAVTPLTPLVITRSMIFNGAAGLLFGGIFITNGFIAAMAAHFSTDIVIHVISPVIISKTDKAGKAEDNKKTSGK